MGSYFFNMAEALAENGHKVVVLTGQTGGLPEKEIKPNLTVLRKFKIDEIGSRKVLKLALDVIDSYSIDLVEGADFLGDCARLLQEKHRPPVLIKVHGCNMLDVVYESQILFFWQRLLIKGALLRNWRLTLREKRSIKQADLLMAPSRRIIQELEHQGVSLPQNKFVLPNPISLKPIETKGEAPNPTLLLVARLDIGKGIQYLPVILKQLLGEFPDLKLEIAGGDSYARGLGYLKKWLREEAGEVAHHISFLGHLDKDGLDAAYKRAWLVIVPSRWDNFPTVILEAMSYCKPVVASPHGGMPEMLEGTLCSVADPDSEEFVQKIAELLRSETLRKDAGHSMFEKASLTYAPDVVAAGYLNFVEKYLRTR